VATKSAGSTRVGAAQQSLNSLKKIRFTSRTRRPKSKNNDTDWGNLEDYILARALTTEQKTSVFTGPIFRANDPWYGRKRTDGPWRIPISFWKIAVLEKEKGVLRTS